MSAELLSFDYAIKYLLKDKGDYEIVEGFISALLKAEGYTAVKIKALLESESNKEEYGLKRAVADLVVEDEQGTHYIVEIERAWTPAFLHKACFNTSRLIVDTLQAGGDYQDIKKVFHISLLYFGWSNSDKALHHGKTIFKEVDTQHTVKLHLKTKEGEVLDLSNVLPEYFLISVPRFDDIIRTEIDEWLYLMKHARVREDFKSPYMQKVKERISVLTMTDKEQHTYYKYMRETFKQRDVLDAAEKKGEAKGIAKGETKAKIEIARKMKQAGLPLDSILTLTGLSSDVVEKIK